MLNNEWKKYVAENNKKEQIIVQQAEMNDIYWGGQW